jgi:hypothetical protein
MCWIPSTRARLDVRRSDNPTTQLNAVAVAAAEPAMAAEAVVAAETRPVKSGAGSISRRPPIAAAADAEAQAPAAGQLVPSWCAESDPTKQGPLATHFTFSTTYTWE